MSRIIVIVATTGRLEDMFIVDVAKSAVVQTSSIGSSSLNFSTVRGLSLVCPFFNSLMRLVIDVGRLIGFGVYCPVEFTVCG